MSEHVALLQIDIVDSTRLGEALGDAAASRLWAEHDRLARALLRDCGGREIDKSDGFLLMFDDAGDALRYALAYRDAIGRLETPLLARSGLHVGAVLQRSNSADEVARGAKPVEIDGAAKPLTARVMAIASPGQLLLTAQAVRALPARPRVLGHGHWRFKGVDAPVEIFEAGEVGELPSPLDSDKAWRVVLRDEMWLPRREVRHTLPAERDAFVGRESALRDLSERFDGGARLISMLGIGGTGKTRLAQRFGWMWLGDFPGGVWFCDLAPASTLDGILHAVAQGLDVTLSGADPVAQIGSAMLGRGRCLVIIDTFEQVSRFAEATIGRWLERAPEARFLVTSREVLAIGGEQAMAVQPLSPAEGRALFLRRAAAARQGFVATAADEPTIASLVRLVDGLPLAIELAAARVRVLSPRHLLARLDERFKLLSSATPSTSRQATLRRTLDWSWNLLSAIERATLAQLSVFEGGFTIAAVEAVIDLSELDASVWVVDVLQALVEKSLVRQLDGERFDLLLTVREYALERLAQMPADPAGTARQEIAFARHWRHYGSLDARAVIAGRCIELDNLTAACRRAAFHGDGAAAAVALESCWQALRICGPLRAAVDLAETVSRSGGLGLAGRARIEYVAASALYNLGRVGEALPRIEAGLALARDAGDGRLDAKLTCAKGELLTTSGAIAEARVHLERALEAAARLGDPVLQCNVLSALGTLYMDQSATREARAKYSAALEVARALGHRRWEGGLLGNLGVVDYAEAAYDSALGHWQQGLAIAEEVGDRLWEGNTRCNLGLLYLERGSSEDAGVALRRALAIARETGHARLECTALCNLGILLESQQHDGPAREHYEAAVRVARELGDKHAEGQFLGHLGALLAGSGDIADARASFAQAEALLAGTEDIANLGMAICKRCEAELAHGDAAAAAAAWAEASSIAEEIPEVSRALLRHRLAELKQRLLQREREDALATPLPG